MKNANIFVDVDLTWVDVNGSLIDGAHESLHKLKEQSCHLFLWSTAGSDYCRSVSSRYGLEDLSEGYTPKPDIVIDDMPNTVMSPFLFNLHEEVSWQAMADKIVPKHID